MRTISRNQGNKTLGMQLIALVVWSLWTAYLHWDGIEAMIQGQATISELGWGTPIILICALALIIFQIASARKVETDGQRFRVSSFGRTVEFDRSDIERYSDNFFNDVIHLKMDTELGRRIQFVAQAEERKTFEAIMART